MFAFENESFYYYDVPRFTFNWKVRNENKWMKNKSKIFSRMHEALEITRKW